LYSANGAADARFGVPRFGVPRFAAPAFATPRFAAPAFATRRLAVPLFDALGFDPLARPIADERVAGDFGAPLARVPLVRVVLRVVAMPASVARSMPRRGARTMQSTSNEVRARSALESGAEAPAARFGASASS
jgi:hypothetical protein